MENAILAAGKLGVPMIPVAFTPSEIQRCLALGCAAVKVFPAYVGGVTPDNLGESLQAGALGVGLGSELVRAGDAAPDYAAISARAQRAAPG